MELLKRVGNCYDTGKGVIQDCSMAVKYFQLAADQDYADAVNSAIL